MLWQTCIRGYSFLSSFSKPLHRSIPQDEGTRISVPSISPNCRQCCSWAVPPFEPPQAAFNLSTGSGSEMHAAHCRAVSFSFGLATTLALLGVGSSLLGKTYGQIGSGLPIAVALVAIAMGLNLLEVLPLRLPSLDLDVRNVSAPPPVQVYAPHLQLTGS